MLCSYVYMFVIDVLAYPVVYTVLIVCVGGPILTGLYFLYGAFFTSLSAPLRKNLLLSYSRDVMM